MEQNVTCFMADFDLTQYPILKVNIKETKDPNIDNVIEFCMTLEKVLDSMEGKFIVLADARNFGWLGAKERIEIGKRVKELEKKFEHRMLKNIIVTSNFITKSVIKAVNIVYKPVIKQIIVDDYNEGLERAKQELKEINMKVML